VSNDKYPGNNNKKGAARGGAGRASGLNLMVNHVHSKRYHCGAQHKTMQVIGGTRGAAAATTELPSLHYLGVDACSIMIPFSEYHKANGIVSNA
jgi:hypothetical protein